MLNMTPTASVPPPPYLRRVRQNYNPSSHVLISGTYFQNAKIPPWGNRLRRHENDRQQDEPRVAGENTFLVPQTRTLTLLSRNLFIIPPLFDDYSRRARSLPTAFFR